MGAASSLAVWAAEVRSGILARERRQEYVFAYSADAGTEAQVSLTMPVRVESWVSRDLHPIFQMNLPEGALLEAIRRAIAKVVGEDDLSILRVTGGNQVGRNRFSLPGDEHPSISDPSTNFSPTLTPVNFSMSLWPDMHSARGYRAFSRKFCWMPQSVVPSRRPATSSSRGEPITPFSPPTSISA
jgi:HipA-like protein